MSLYENFKGSLLGGDFYKNILAKPVKDGWKLLILLLAISSILYSINIAYLVYGYMGKFQIFYSAQNWTVEFVNGEIMNIPFEHKTYSFQNSTIDVDKKYIAADSVYQDIDSTLHTALFIGPKASYIVTKGVPREIAYPISFSKIIDEAYLAQLKLIITVGAFIIGLVSWFILKFIESIFYVAIIISSILLFKFRRMGLAYSEAFKAGLFLASYQITISSILIILGLQYIWVHLLYILIYFIFIGGFVNIDLTSSRSRLFLSDSGNKQ